MGRETANVVSQFTFKVTLISVRFVRVAISQNSLSGTIQDVPQIEALGTPAYVVLSGFTETKVTLKVVCAGWGCGPRSTRERLRLARE